MLEITESHICCQESIDLLHARGAHHLYNDKPNYHRKQWEDMFILNVLESNNRLEHEVRGLGFAVGQESLPAAFARRGVEVLATDLNFDEAKRRGWVKTNQHLSSRNVLYRDWVDRDVFNDLVSYEEVNMNAIPEHLRQHQFDFVWSTCSFEHLGSLRAGIAFVINAMECLKPFGMAVHTTEFNLSSNTDTMEGENSVIYREQDMRQLAMELSELGHTMSNNFEVNLMEMDKRIDFLPHTQDPHIRLQIERYLATSYGIVIYAKG